MSGTNVVVGTPFHGSGAAYVFTPTAQGWRQEIELDAPDATGNDAFGQSVGISGSTVVVGAPGHASKAGRAYAFTKTTSSWEYVELKGSDTVPDDAFGQHVGINGTILLVGAPRASRAGRAYVFFGIGGRFAQVAELAGSDTTAGSYFGGGIAVSGATAVVGVGGGGVGIGHVYVFNA